jgi:hypothetical protein
MVVVDIRILFRILVVGPENPLVVGLRNQLADLQIHLVGLENQNRLGFRNLLVADLRIRLVVDLQIHHFVVLV